MEMKHRVIMADASLTLYMGSITEKIKEEKNCLTTKGIY